MIVVTKINILRVLLQIIHACVIQIQFSLVLHSASRIAAAAVIIFAGKQGDLLVLPVYQILADRMPPVHPFPESVVRIVLVEKMVFPLEINQSIRIV